VLAYLLDIIVGVAALGFGVALMKLLAYHFGLIRSGLTTNEDLKDIYGIIKEQVPFSRCSPDHPPLVHLSEKLIRCSEIEVSLEDTVRRSSTTGLPNKGKRYSTLVSDRQSVLNSLV
jgi:hypothetical protein